MVGTTLGEPRFATTLAHGLAVLDCFRVGEPLLSNKDFVARTGLSKATISRLTYTLSLMGFLKYDISLRKYRLGSAVVSIGYPLLASLSIRQLARPLMKTLADYARGSVSLGMRDRTHMVYVETSRGHETLAFRPDSGASLPILATAMGRAWLCKADPTLQETVLEQIRRTDPGQWHAHHDALAEARRDFDNHGYCISRGDFQRDIHAVAVAIHDPIESEIMVFNCGVLALQLGPHTLEDEIAPRLVAMVRDVETGLGHR